MVEQLPLFDSIFDNFDDFNSFENSKKHAKQKLQNSKMEQISQKNQKESIRSSNFFQPSSGYDSFENIDVIANKNENIGKSSFKNLPLSSLKIDYKNILNDSQFMGVTTTEGPVLLLAGAGSGKTHCLINRVSYLIEQGIAPEKILLLTFTNKAANEMQERAAKILDERCNKIVALTYHSFFNSKVLRKFGHYVGLKPGYTVIEPSDTVEIIDMIKTDRDLKKDKNFPKSARIATYISMSLNKNYSIEECLMKEYNGADIEYIKDLESLEEDYNSYKLSHNLIDFDDILIKSIELFKSNDNVRKYYEDMFDYIMVDEYQDSNFLQDELVNLIRQKNHNLCVVGDDSQCLLPGTPILTKNGYKNIENINMTDNLIVATGRGDTNIATKIGGINKTFKETKVVKITTKSNKTITGTADHIVFANYMMKDTYFIVLMYKKGFGFRIDYSKSSTTKGKTLKNGYEIKMANNGAEKLWILETADTLKNAKKIMNFYSRKYSIPLNPFIFNKNNSDYNASLFNKTAKNGFILLDDLNMFFQEPHALSYKRISKNLSEIMKEDESLKEKNVLHFTMFGCSRQISSRHEKNYPEFPKRYQCELSFSTEDKEFKEICRQEMNTIIKPLVQSNGVRRYVGRKQFQSQDEAIETIENICNKRGSVRVVREAAMVEEKTKFRFTPMSNLRKGMTICAYDENTNTIIYEPVKDIEVSDYSGYVYDINVPELRNFIANGIVAHNCIYGFRGSIVKNIINFPIKHPGCKTIKLIENYRSSQEIMDLSNSFMKHHCTEGIPKSLVATHYYMGTRPQLIRPYSEKEEAEKVLSMIEDCLVNGMDSKDIAVLSRSSTDTSQLEVLLTKNGYEYEKYGGLKFFDKEIVKDILAFIKVIINYRDEVAWSRILKLLPSIGDKTVRKITPLCLESGFVGLLNFKRNGKSGEIIKKNLFNLHELISKLMDEDNPEKIMKMIVEYYYPLKKELIEAMKTTDLKRDEYMSHLSEGMEDANFLIDLASQYNKLSSFVDDVILEKKTEKDDKKALENKAKKITISTIHSSKGLEWETVFLLNCIDGRFPNIMPWQIYEKEKENNEELRCFYVAVTRARQYLYMFAPKMARIGANFGPTQVSHFLKGSEDYYDIVDDNY